MSDPEITSHSNGHTRPLPQKQQASTSESLFDVVLLLMKHHRLILFFALGFGVLGLILAITSNAEYTASATLVIEHENDAPMGATGNFSLLNTFGIKLKKISL